MHLFVLGKEHFLCQGLFCVCGIAAEGIFIRKPQETAGGWQRDTQAHPVKRREKLHPATGREKSHPATGQEKRRRNNDGTVQSGFHDLFQELSG